MYDRKVYICLLLIIAYILGKIKCFVWLDEYGVDLATTVSPALNYDAPEKWSERVTEGLVKNFVKYFGISVPEQK